MSEVIIEERGWAGHHASGNSCLFRRNTLISKGEKRLVVSSVGRWVYGGKIVAVGAGNRCFETVCCKAVRLGDFWEVELSAEVPVWKTPALKVPKQEICLESLDSVPLSLDLEANNMHEDWVKFVSKNIDKLWKLVMEEYRDA